MSETKNAEKLIQKTINNTPMVGTIHVMHGVRRTVGVFIPYIAREDEPKAYLATGGKKIDGVFCYKAMPFTSAQLACDYANREALRRQIKETAKKTETEDRKAEAAVRQEVTEYLANQDKKDETPVLVIKKGGHAEVDGVKMRTPEVVKHAAEILTKVW